MQYTLKRLVLKKTMFLAFQVPNGAPLRTTDTAMCWFWVDGWVSSLTVHCTDVDIHTKIWYLWVRLYWDRILCRQLVSI